MTPVKAAIGPNNAEVFKDFMAPHLRGLKLVQAAKVIATAQRSTPSRVLFWCTDARLNVSDLRAMDVKRGDLGLNDYACAVAKLFYESHLCCFAK